MTPLPNAEAKSSIVKLTGILKGFTAKRIAQSGRLWLVRVIDNPPSWVVLIRGFDPIRDRASRAKSVGAWRFVNELGAIAKFNELRTLYPPNVTEPLSDILRYRRTRIAKRKRLVAKSHHSP